MKTIEKEVNVNFIESGCNVGFYGNEYYYKFTTNKPLFNMKVFGEEYVPENMGEFRELHNIDSKKLLEWLNKNYK